MVKNIKIIKILQIKISQFLLIFLVEVSREAQGDLLSALDMIKSLQGSKQFSLKDLGFENDEPPQSQKTMKKGVSSSQGQLLQSNTTKNDGLNEFNRLRKQLKGKIFNFGFSNF